MGQANTKPQDRHGNSPERDPIHQEERTPKEKEVLQQQQQTRVIEQQPTFDSHFTLISPMSELSDPSQFLWKRQHSHATPGLGRTIIRNVPPLPPELQRAYNPNERPHDGPPLMDEGAKTKKKKKKNMMKKARRVKEAFAGCVIVTADHANTMRKATTKAVTTCARKTGDAIEDSGVIEKSGAAALNCAKASKAIAEQRAMDVARVTSTVAIQGAKATITVAAEGAGHVGRAIKNSRLSGAGRELMENVSEPVPRIGYEDTWRESEGMLHVGQDVTPLAQLDRTFAAAIGLHQEDDYFDRLAGLTAPSPFVHNQREYEADADDEDDGYEPEAPDSPVTSTSLFSDRSENRVEEPRKKTVIQSIQEFDAIEKIPNEKNRSGSYLRDRTQQTKKSSNAVKAREVKPVVSNGISKRASQEIFRPKGMQDLLSKQEKSYGSLRVTESAPSVLQSSRDYRNIALSTSEGAFSLPARVQPKHYTLCSPGSSVCSSAPGTPQGPLINNDVLSNAAFLFSPSYAGGDDSLLLRQQAARDPAFSISTFASRARLSTVSSRSQPVFAIPVSSSWELREESSPTKHDFISISDSPRKHVRFSDANELFEIRAFNQMKADKAQSIIERNFPTKVETPEIETKLSDLTEAAMSLRTFPVKTSDLNQKGTRPKVHTDQNSNATSSNAASVSSFSDLSARRISLSALSSERISPASALSDSTSNTNRFADNASHTDHDSALSSKEDSIHWTYREGNGKVTMTPMIGKKRQPSNTKPTASPMLRFQAAKSKFANPKKQASPVRKTPPKKFANRTPKKTLVSNRINDLDNRSKNNRQHVPKNIRRDTSGHEVLAPHRPNLVNPIFLPKSVPNDKEGKIVRKVSNINESAENPKSFDEEVDSADDSVKSLLVEKNVPSEDNSFHSAETEMSDDPFTAIIQSNYEPAPEDEASAPRGRTISFSGNSVYSFASQTSSLRRQSFGTTTTTKRQSRGSNTTEKRQSLATSSRNNRQSIGSTMTDKENTVPLTNLHKKAGKSHVNPADVHHPGANTRSLCLSPTQRTPMQARKWRTLAAAAYEKDKNKKSATKKSGLVERSLDIQ